MMMFEQEIVDLCTHISVHTLRRMWWLYWNWAMINLPEVKVIFWILFSSRSFFSLPTKDSLIQLKKIRLFPHGQLIFSSRKYFVTHFFFSHKRNGFPLPGHPILKYKTIPNSSSPQESIVEINSGISWENFFVGELRSFVVDLPNDGMLFVIFHDSSHLLRTRQTSKRGFQVIRKISSEILWGWITLTSNYSYRHYQIDTIFDFTIFARSSLCSTDP